MRMTTNDIATYIAIASIAAAALMVTGARAVSAQPIGHLPLKIAVIAYDPIMSNRPGNPRLHTACNWSDPMQMARAHTNWWDLASRGMVRCELVTNVILNIWPMKIDGFRYTAESYWAIYTNGWKGAHTPDAIHYEQIFTNDAPWITNYIERGLVDQVWMYMYPYAGTYETRMVGKGAYEANSSGMATLRNERLFMVNFPSIERPDTPMENFGHGCEGILGAWFWNHLLNYPGWADSPYTNINDFALFTRALSNSPDNVHCGNVHFAPNSFSDYDWGSTRMVLCNADAWYSFPVLTNPPRMMNTSEWGNGVNHLHKIWWFQHMPQKVGLHRGHLMNWMTYYLDLNRASYPLGATQLTQNDVDLAGWFAFEVYAPPGTTQITCTVNAGRGVEFGANKDRIPLNNRFNWWSPNNARTDYWVNTRLTTHSLTLNENKHFNRGLTGYWYFSFGRAYTDPTSRPKNSATNYTVAVSILPTPTNMAAPTIDVSDPGYGEMVSGRTGIVNWSVSGLPQGVRAHYLRFSTNDLAGPWQDICEDYHYHFTSNYVWFLPRQTSDNARVMVVTEDVYGVQYTNYSAPFGLNAPYIPEPTLLVTPLAWLLRGRAR